MLHLPYWRYRKETPCLMLYFMCPYTSCWDIWVILFWFLYTSCYFAAGVHLRILMLYAYPSFALTPCLLVRRRHYDTFVTHRTCSASFVCQVTRSFPGFRCIMLITISLSMVSYMLISFQFKMVFKALAKSAVCWLLIMIPVDLHLYRLGYPLLFNPVLVGLWRDLHVHVTYLPPVEGKFQWLAIGEAVWRDIGFDYDIYSLLQMSFCAPKVSSNG